MGRPPRPIISRNLAAKAALAEIDNLGLEGFGLSDVAARLGVKTPSLYHHFKNKDELLGEVARLLLIEAPLPEPVAGLDWREEVVRIARASRRAVLRHPNSAALLLRFFPRRMLIGAYERWAAIFALNGVPVEWRVLVLEGADKLTFGSALFGAASRATQTDSDPEIEPGRYPYFTQALEANTLDDEETFVVCLRAFLHGLPLDRPPPVTWRADKPN